MLIQVQCTVRTCGSFNHINMYQKNFASKKNIIHKRKQKFPHPQKKGKITIMQAAWNMKRY